MGEGGSEISGEGSSALNERNKYDTGTILPSIITVSNPFLLFIYRQQTTSQEAA